MTDSSVTAKRETVRLVPDLPADDDEFAGHGHSTVAHAIAQLIKKEHGGRVIGLEGTWGSGKSTIVSLVRRELEAQPARSGGEQTRVAIFDAWAHQGDPLRRTFLESLLTHLVGWEWLTKKQARNFRNKFTGKTSTAIIKSTPRFTWEGRAASAAVLLIPLGAAAFDNHFSHFHHLLIYAGLVLAVSPILVVLGFAVALRLLHWRGKCTDTEAFSFFTEDQVKETTTKSIERGEPTSVEFERFFRKILGATINEQRRCVLVLDNLDRVGQADARSIIATMQTFTGMPASSTDDHWRSRVWTLIPYDPDGLGHLWESGSETAEEGSGEDPSAAKGNTRAAAVTVADAFLEKLFEVRFSTPRVVHSDWRQYLTHLLSEAFPNRSPEELRRVAGLRVQYPSASPTGRVALEEPTPRQLKQYVNAIGAILRGTSAVPLIDVAYYCLLQRDGIDVMDRLVHGSLLPHASLRFLLTSDVKDDLAALCFGTEPRLAQQLLLREPLDRALRQNKVDELRSLSERAGFKEAVEELDISAWARDSGAVELTRAVAPLQEAGLLTGELLHEWVEDYLLPTVSTVGVWRLAGTESGRGLAAIANLLPDDGARSNLLKRIEPMEADKPAVAEGSNSALQGLATLASDLEPSLVQGLRIRLAVPAEELVSVLAYFRRLTESPAAWSVPVPPVNASNVSETVVTSAASNATLALQAVEVLLARPERLDRAVVMTGCAGFLRTEEVTDEARLDDVLRIIDAVRTIDLQASLEELASDGTLMNSFQTASANSWATSAAYASMLFLAAQASTVDPAVVGNSAAGIARLRELLGNPAVDTGVANAQGQWLASHSAEAWSLLMKQLVAARANQAWVDYQLRLLREAGQLAVPVAEFAESFAIIQRALGEEEFRVLLAEMLEETNTRLTVIGGSASPVLAREAFIVTTAVPRLAAAHADVLAWVKDMLVKAEEAVWVESLEDTSGGPMVLLALVVGSTADAPVLGVALDEALRTHARSLRDSKPAWTPTSDDFSKIAGLLDASAQDNLASNLCSQLEGRDGDEIGAAFFEVYGDFLSRQPSFRSHDKLPSVVERLVAAERWDAIEWFVAVAREHGDTLIEDHRKGVFDVLRRNAAEKFTALGEAAPEQLRQLLGLLGVDTSTVQADEDGPPEAKKE